MTSKSPPDVSDPWAVLALPVGACAADVRAAYLRKVRQHPPERSPEQFERIRDAYEELRDPRRRGERMIESVDPDAEFVSLLGDGAEKRRFTGPGPWLDVLEKA